MVFPFAALAAPCSKRENVDCGSRAGVFQACVTKGEGCRERVVTGEAAVQAVSHASVRGGMSVARDRREVASRTRQSSHERLRTGRAQEKNIRVEYVPCQVDLAGKV